MSSYFVGGNYGELLWVTFLLGYSLLLLNIGSSLAFNIDVKNVKDVSGTPGSQFGSSLVFDASKNRLLVGAPKEVENIKGENLHTGVIHSCSLDSLNKVDCSQTSYSFPKFYEDSKSVKDEGYGWSISISDTGNVTVCAPRWKDTNFMRSHYTFVPGRCIFDPDNEKVSDVHPYYHENSGQQYLPGDDYHHGLASFGFSSDSTEESTVVYGAPGLTIFEGGIYIRDHNRAKSTATSKLFSNTVATGTAYGYLGYEVKFGKFCDDDILCLAAGAPNLYTTGVVRLYKWLNSKFLYDYQDLKGEKTWSYFGSALCAVDTDNDGLDELLVGAPYYGDDDSNSFDAGKVYVYKRDKSEKDDEDQNQDVIIHVTLNGSGNKYSRFGSAIQKIGDLNLDKYQDVAIGAPGEEDDKGCIYIYLGSPGGIVTKFSQRICATEIKGKSLKYFGSTISTPIKQPGSPYPVFAASSYATDTVIFFNTRVIVRPEVTITASPNPIDLNKKSVSCPEPCTILDVCFNQRMVGVATEKLDFVVNIEADTQRRKGVQQRVQFKDAADKLVDDLGTVTVDGLDTSGRCHKYTVVTNKNQVNKDRFTPIEFKVTMEIDDSSSSGIDPVFDPSVPNTFTYMVSLANDCGLDNVCDVDLSVAGTIAYSHEENWPYVVVGHTKEIRLDLTISNTEETSYGTQVRVELNQPIPFLRFLSDTIKQCKPESSNSGIDTKTVVVCNYYQPLKKDSSVDISIAFDTRDVALDRRTIKVIAKTMPTLLDNSREKNNDDNTKKMTTSVYIVADVDVFGSSSPAEVTLKNSKRLSLTAQEPVTTNFTNGDDNVDTVVLNHKYQMKNMGPSFLPKTKIYISIPAYLPDATQLISRASIQLQTEDQPAVSCTKIVKKIDSGIDFFTTTSATMTTASIDQSVSTEDSGDGGTKPTTRWTPDGGVNKRRKRSADDDHVHNDENEYSKTYSLTCETSLEYCVTFRCDIKSDIQSGGYVSLNVTLDVDRENIPIPEGFTSFLLQLKSLVQQPRHILFKRWDRESEQQATARTSTIFHTVESGGEINIWIIIGSVIAGLFLIFIIAIIFWKLGFFKRKRHLEMEEWREARSPPQAGTEN